MVTNQETVTLIQAESERVRRYLNELPEDVLECPTPSGRSESTLLADNL